MPWPHLIACFFAGVFLANAAPHVVSGMMGKPFQSPFAKPPGRGLSSSTVNVLWGFFNLAVGYVFLVPIGDFNLKRPIDVVALGLGALSIGLFAARHFGRFNGGNDPKQP